MNFGGIEPPQCGHSILTFCTLLVLQIFRFQKAEVGINPPLDVLDGRIGARESDLDPPKLFLAINDRLVKEPFRAGLDRAVVVVIGVTGVRGATEPRKQLRVVTDTSEGG